MKVLLLGANGQLGRELRQTCPDTVALTAAGRTEVDITRPDSLQRVLAGLCPDWVINTAAYTQVDRAETEPDLADRINHQGVRNLAAALAGRPTRLVQISTDFVFNGRHHRPYQPSDTTDPQSVYGRTKRDGETAAGQLAADQVLIIRTAWLYAAHGHNFVRTMLQLMREKDRLTVVDDQIGSPTWARGLAWLIWTALRQNQTGLWHWTDAGVASWYDFAVAIQEEAINQRLLSQAIPIMPVSTRQYPTPARRPPYSVLDKTETQRLSGLPPVHWRTQLRTMLAESLPPGHQ